jgi:NAD(P)-dependent dehydrogenase (short-subunit alcohol dehydrogenase family)
MSANIGEGRAVLVTGASRGLGRHATLHLADLGFRVYAGVRREADGASLCREAGEGVQPILLDVTRDEEIEAAVGTVSGEVGDDGLWGLVNNAGIAIFGPLETTPVREVRRLFEVNLFGLLTLTQEFLPLIRRARGRIVNLSSINGFLSMPFVGAYSASKFALEAATDALRMELARSGIGVSLIQPGITASDIRQFAFEDWTRRREALSGEERDRYASYHRAGLGLAENLETDAADPAVVSAAVEHALTAERPRTRYPTGEDAAQFAEIAASTEEERDAVLLSMWEVQT